MLLCPCSLRPKTAVTAVSTNRQKVEERGEQCRNWERSGRLLPRGRRAQGLYLFSTPPEQGPLFKKLLPRLNKNMLLTICCASLSPSGLQPPVSNSQNSAFQTVCGAWLLQNPET